MTQPETPRAITNTKPLWRRGLALAFAAFSVVYLLNLTAGIFPELPDNLPLIGNVDEAAMTGLLIYCLRYLGIDLFTRGGGD